MRDQDIPRHSYDERLTDAQRHEVDRAYAESRQKGSSDWAPPSGGAGGGLAGVALVGMLAFFLFYAAFFPLTGFLTIAAGYLVSTVFSYFVPGVGGLAQLLLLLPFMFIAWTFARELERRLEPSRAFRLIRHACRLVLMGAIAYYLIEFVRLVSERQLDEVPIEALSARGIAIIAGFVIVTHFAGRWYDKRIAAVAAPIGTWQDGSSGAGASRTTIAVARRRWMTDADVPFMRWAPPALRRAVAAFTACGALFGGFLGYAGFETWTATLLGLAIGGAVGTIAMLLFWLVTRPIGGLLNRVPVLWPILIGASLGAALAWRLAVVDEVPLGFYVVTGIIGGSVALTVPCVMYRLIRSVFPSRHAAKAVP